ncbi:MAG: hypothetical protein R2699_03035 [Acidimicrobiales bacterium]
MAVATAKQSLGEILEAFEQANERRPSNEEESELLARSDWLADFEEVRERVVRTTFESLAWEIEQRGHHAWIEELATHADAQGVTGIGLRVLPVADQRTAHQAPTLELAPDPAHRRVVAAVHDVDLTDPIRHVVALVDLDRLDEAAVRTLATKLIDIVFLQRSRVLDRPEGADPEDWAPERGGVVPTRGESADWLG